MPQGEHITTGVIRQVCGGCIRNLGASTVGQDAILPYAPQSQTHGCAGVWLRVHYTPSHSDICMEDLWPVVFDDATIPDAAHVKRRPDWHHSPLHSHSSVSRSIASCSVSFRSESNVRKIQRTHSTISKL